MKPINECKTLPLTREAVAAFESLKKCIEESVVTAIDENLPFDVETNASNCKVAIAATLNQILLEDITGTRSPTAINR